MSIVEVKVPQLSESVAEATLLQWKKKPGEAVEMDEILIEIETDKVVLEVPAPASGVLGELVAADGATVAAEQVIARIDTEGQGRRRRRRAGGRAGCACGCAGRRCGGRGQGRRRHAGRGQAAGREQDVAPATWPARGRDGRVTKGDVLGALAAPKAAPKAAPGSGAGHGRAAAASGRAGRGAAGRPARAARADVAAARPRGRAAAAVAGHQRHPDHLQRGQHGPGDGHAQALPGALREGARRQDRLHELLRQGRGGRAEEVTRCSTPASTAPTSSTTATSTSASPSARRAAWWCRSCATPTR